MTTLAQTHIDTLGEALRKLEAAHEGLGNLLSGLPPKDPATDDIQASYDRLGIHIKRLHYRLANAQADYIAEHGDGTLVAFAVLPGGTNKPPPDDPDAPVED